MRAHVVTSPWFMCPQPRPQAALRLFCLPFAGAGASVYRAWPQALPDGVELRAVQLPGRESRLREARATCALQLAGAIADALEPWVERPFALFGYSFGALLAFETARELRRRGAPQPACLFAAARHAPQLAAVHPPLGALPPAEFVAAIEQYYRPEDAAWNIPELRAIVLPILRDDVRLADAYAYAHEAPLGCPIEAFVGAQDRSVPTAHAQAWREQTVGGFALHTLPGGHFFLHTAGQQLLQAIACRLNALTGACP